MFWSRRANASPEFCRYPPYYFLTGCLFRIVGSLSLNVNLCFSVSPPHHLLLPISFSLPFPPSLPLYSSASLPFSVTLCLVPFAARIFPYPLVLHLALRCMARQSAPLAKLLVQRSRRESSRRNSKYSMNALHLSPGTKFMEDMASAIEYYAFQECTRPW